MALPSRDLEEGPAALVPLFGNDVQAWTQDQIKLNDEIQHLITQIHADNGCDWSHVQASVATYLRGHPALYCNTVEDVRPSLVTGLGNDLVRYGSPNLYYSIARFMTLGTDFDL